MSEDLHRTIDTLREENYRLKNKLRDEFAMAALQGILASETKDNVKNISDASYMMADAMMEARK